MARKPIILFKNKVSLLQSSHEIDSHLFIQGTWMEQLFPDGFLERPARYKDQDEWSCVMKVNQNWPFSVESSSVVTCFMSASFQGEIVLKAVESVTILGRRGSLASRDISALYQGFRLYMVTTGAIVADIVAHIRMIEMKFGMKFWIGDDDGSPDCGSLLEALAPASEVLWNSHLKILLDLRTKTMSPKGLTLEHALEIRDRMREARSLLLSIIPLCVIDYCFHLRKNLTKAAVWDVIKDNVNTERLKDFPKFRGMRLQVIAGLVAAIPKQDRDARLANTAPQPLPVPRWLFLAACDSVHSRGFLRPLQRIVGKARAVSRDGRPEGNAMEHAWGG
mmetsp:Transcript_12566/g.29853  ORF Transcript_12566/g.29853 Transcript_12566/m.29853 type:complete len:335 (+) Transcript_12566:179-1183(+)